MDSSNVIYLFGDPVSHTLSPVFQNAALSELGLNCRYKLRKVSAADLPQALRGLLLPGVRGANLTVPHKMAALTSLDALTQTARAIGAVNTVSIGDEGLIGHNTDGEGFLAALRSLRPEGLPRPGVLLIGAGGAARAVACGMMNEGIAESLLLLCRNRIRGEGLLETLALRSILSTNGLTLHTVLTDPGSITEEMKEGIGLIINATPLGMGELIDQTPLPDLDGFQPDTLVFDLVYGLEPTRLMQTATTAGLEATDGFEMLLQQGALSLAIWTGQDPPLEIMRKALQEAISQSEGM